MSVNRLVQTIYSLGGGSPFFQDQYVETSLHPKDWYQLLDEILHSGEKKSARAKKMLKENLISATPIFEARPFFMNDEFSLIDCALAPLLWRLNSIGIDLNSLGQTVNQYAQRIFSRDAFIASLSEAK